MTGSSARKLRRGYANLPAGRGWRYGMTPLSYETEGFDLEDICISGLLPPHFASPDKSPSKIDSALEVLPWQYFLEALWSGNLGV